MSKIDLVVTYVHLGRCVLSSSRMRQPQGFVGAEPESSFEYRMQMRIVHSQGVLILSSQNNTECYRNEA